jgi:pimeloyl-ACP methyl ester carboxylesterase
VSEAETAPKVDPNARVIQARYDKRGEPRWESQMSAPDSSFALCYMVPDRIIPVIFVPGVMGSNLVQRGVATDAAIRWRLDSATTAGRWALADYGAEFRKRHLTPTAMEVDPGGAVPGDLSLPGEELRRRGWGEIGALSYAPILRWLEQALNDFENPHDGERVRLIREELHALVGEVKLTKEEVGLTYRYRFPVYACGYNWLDDNANSSLRLSKRIDEIRRRYAQEKKKCDKVIIVTHSMGGLVARHCSEVLNRREDVLGVVHGVMPAIGAAAVYRRFKSGTEDLTGWYNVKGAAVASALGNDAAEMTAVLSSAPGPMQLLPTSEYGNGWLKVSDGGVTHSLPQKNDPYNEIYAVRGRWWSMCEDHLINPLNKEADPQKKQAVLDTDWMTFRKLIFDSILPFHEQIQKRYHPETHAFFGSHTDHRAYGEVTWRLQTNRNYYAPSEVMAGTLVGTGDKGTTRTVKVVAPTPADARSGAGMPREERRVFHISDPDEAGDGTVPHRSGSVPRAQCKAFLQANVEHEPAFNVGKGPENLRACRFTLRAIVKIAQSVQQTSLRYE